jgi:hypothetical protein
MSGIEIGIILAIVGVVFAAPPALHSFTHCIMRLRAWLSRRRLRRRAEDKSSSAETSKVSKRQHTWRGLVGRKSEVKHADEDASPRNLYKMSIFQGVLILLVVGMVLTSGCAFIAVGLLIIVHGTSPAICSQALYNHSSLLNNNDILHSDTASNQITQTYCWGIRRLPRASR